MAAASAALKLEPSDAKAHCRRAAAAAALGDHAAACDDLAVALRLKPAAMEGGAALLRAWSRLPPARGSITR